MVPVRPSNVITRHRGGAIHAYALDSNVLGRLEPVAVFHPRSGDEAVESAVWPDLERVEAFGYDPEETFVEWSGGYLTSDLAVVTLGGEDPDGEEEWFRYHLVDVRTGTLSGEITVESTNPYELVPLGDGSWLTAGPDGNPFRWSAATTS
ncbi:hypothetical protein ACWGIN_27580 [Streptomyces sp. NPDC054861]